jgi:broad specificity phosphatase PhoE
VAEDQVPDRLLIVRHAPTEWSETRRHTGRTDVPLTEDGAAAARALKSRLDRIVGLDRPALVLSSPLSRALDTCRLAGCGEAVETTDLLLEMDYGDYEGRTTVEIRKDRPNWDLFIDGSPGGETIEDVGRRVDLLRYRLRSDEALRGATVLVFAHGHVLRVLTARWLGLEAEAARSFFLATTGVGVFGWEHEWPVLNGWNC